MHDKADLIMWLVVCVVVVVAAAVVGLIKTAWSALAG